MRGLENIDFLVEKYNLVVIGPKWCQKFDKKFSFRQKCLNRNILTTKVGYSAKMALSKIHSSDSADIWVILEFSADFKNITFVSIRSLSHKNVTSWV